MNCKEFEAAALELTRHFSAASAAQREALGHVEHCTACARRFAEEQVLTAQLRQVSRSLDGAQIPSRVDAAVHKAFEQRTARLAASSVQRASYRRQKWIIGFGAVAAAIPLLFVVFQRTPEMPQPAGGVAINNQVVSNPERPSAVEVDSQKVKEPVVPSDAVSTHVAVASSDTDDTTVQPDAPTDVPLADVPSMETGEFIPISPGGNPVLGPAGPIVRVEVSGAVLQSIGFPIPGDLYGRRVEADLMLGEDGIARGIRFPVGRW